MASNRLDAAKSGAEAPKSGPDEKAAETASASKAGGGAKAWLPLAVTVVAMPILAYATTTFMLIPKLQKSFSPASSAAPEEHAESAEPAAQGSSHGSSGGNSKGGKEGSGSKAKVTVPMREKILVNVAGTAGTRYLIVNFTLVGNNSNLRTLLSENEAQIRDLAAGVLSTKTIADLEKPGARNLIRSELITTLNNLLGGNSIQEVFFTEFAVQ